MLSSPYHHPIITLSSPCHHPIITLSSPYHHPIITPSSPCHHPIITLSSPYYHPIITPSSPCHHPIITLSSPYHHPIITLSSPYHHPIITLLSPHHHPVITLSSPCHHPIITLLSPHHHNIISLLLFQFQLIITHMITQFKPQHSPILTPPPHPIVDCKRCKVTDGVGYLEDSCDCQKYYQCQKINDLQYIVYHKTCADCTVWDGDKLTCVLVDQCTTRAIKLTTS